MQVGEVAEVQQFKEGKKRAHLSQANATLLHETWATINSIITCLLVYIKARAGGHAWLA